MTLDLRFLLLLLPLALLCTTALAGVPAPEEDAAAEALSLAKSDYVENCGGCHGIQGSSAPANIPVLRDRIGYFLCTPESRAYLIRLPNVAHSRLTDNEQLAQLLNFTVFGFGGLSVPAGSARFTSEEVARERQHALSSQSLKKMRATLVKSLIRTCKAPASLRLLYPGQHVDRSNR